MFVGNCLVSTGTELSQEADLCQKSFYPWSNEFYWNSYDPTFSVLPVTSRSFESVDILAQNSPINIIC